MESGDGSYVPRVTGHGTCQEAAFVVSEVGNDYLHELLWEPGDWRWTCGGRLWGRERLHDFGFGSVPKLVDEEFTRCRSVNKTTSLNGM